MTAGRSLTQADAAAAGRAGPPIASKLADDPVVGHLVVEFVADLPAQLAELAEAAGAPDQVRTCRLSHRLTGDAATYGYPELAHVARELELATAGSQPPPDLAKLARLLTALQVIGQRICAGRRSPG